MGQAGPFAALAAGAMPVTAAIAATRAMTTTRVATSLCFTRFSLSAARRTSTATAACRSDLRLGFPLLRAARRVTG
jgi:hypothetical protein